MAPERRDGEGDSPAPGEHGDIADAYSPPVPPSKATRSKFMLGVVGVVVVALLVFVVALLLR